ncbi:hypothetical protein [Falsiroseomonas oryziterrae]|uniref:hypothetical protein n=1 Tax=Falsiroseomonas oryziterrae TaxID=2911368 RepID=UPI001F4110C7|nr:hypothetical protein [Roseomonas sp. NPKOSM-4]
MVRFVRSGFAFDHRRRIDGEDIVFRAGSGFRWVDLDRGYRLHFARRRGLWVVRRAGSTTPIATARTLDDAFRAAKRHFRALS